jgi:hypothetical protein
MSHGHIGFGLVLKYARLATLVIRALVFLQRDVPGREGLFELAIVEIFLSSRDLCGGWTGGGRGSGGRALSGQYRNGKENTDSDTQDL